MEQNFKKFLAGQKAKNEVDEHTFEETKAQCGDNVMKYFSPFFLANSKQDKSSMKNTNEDTTLKSNMPQLVESKTNNTGLHGRTYGTKSTGDAFYNKVPSEVSSDKKSVPGAVHGNGIVFSEEELKRKFEKCTLLAIKPLDSCDGLYYYLLTTTIPLPYGKYKLCPIEIRADNARPELSKSKSLNSSVDVSEFFCQIIDGIKPMSGDNTGGSNTSNEYSRRRRRRSRRNASFSGMYKSKNLFRERKHGI